MFLSADKQKKIFIIFWLPIIVLALIGSIGELTNSMQCPRTEAGTPKCYFSAIYSAIIGVLAWFYFVRKDSKMGK